jgi:hypothetical protein
MTARFVVTDGGRAAAGYRGQTNDCVCRAIAIAAELPYREVYRALADRAGKSSRAGVDVNQHWFKELMRELDFVWYPVERSGRNGQFSDLLLGGDEPLPSGRVILHLEGHSLAVIDGVVHDSGYWTRGGSRYVYSYWRLERRI